MTRDRSRRSRIKSEPFAGTDGDIHAFTAFERNDRSVAREIDARLRSGDVAVVARNGAPGGETPRSLHGRGVSRIRCGCEDDEESRRESVCKSRASTRTWARRSSRRLERKPGHIPSRASFPDHPHAHCFPVDFGFYSSARARSELLPGAGEMRGPACRRCPPPRLPQFPSAHLSSLHSALSPPRFPLRRSARSRSFRARRRRA